VKVVRTRRGARIVEDDVVLSELLAKPGPTHALFDVLAACVAVLAPGPRFAMLGFAGGGIVAPLRALDFPHPVRAVDLSRDGEALFRELSSEWAGDVCLEIEDAADWLRRRRGRWDLILEDLSVPSPAGTVKPYASFDTLPGLIHRRLTSGGIALTNLLPLPGTSWDALTSRIAHPHRNALAVHFEEYENRFVVAGDSLPSAVHLSRRLGSALRSIGSGQCGRISVRTVFRS
jgi:spermidine synthase